VNTVSMPLAFRRRAIKRPAWTVVGASMLMAVSLNAGNGLNAAR
jgi:hypothetical protein